MSSDPASRLAEWLRQQRGTRASYAAAGALSLLAVGAAALVDAAWGVLALTPLVAAVAVSVVAGGAGAGLLSAVIGAVGGALVGGDPLEGGDAARWATFVVTAGLLIGLGALIDRGRRRAEVLRAEASEARARFEAAQERSPDAFLILRPLRRPDGSGGVGDFTIEHANPAARRMLEAGDGERIDGRSLSECIPARTDGRLLTRLSTALATGEPVDVEVRELLGRGAGWHRLTAVRLGDGVAATIADVTDRRRVEERLRLVAAVGDALDSAVGLDARLDRLVQILVQRWSADVAVVDLGTRPGGPRTVVATGSGVSPSAAACLPGPAEAPPSGPVLVRLPPDAPLRRAIVAPLVARGRHIGVLSLGMASDTAPVDESDLATARSVAVRAAFAIENARLLEEARAALSRVDRLQRVTSALSSSLTMEAVARVVIDQACAHAGAAAAAVAIAVPETGMLRVLAATGGLGGEAFAHEQIPVLAPTPLAAAVHEGRPVWLSSPAQVERGFPAAAAGHRAAGFGAAACVPIPGERSPLGGLALAFAGPREFAQEDRDFITTLATLAGQALERARLFTEARHVATTLQEAILPARLAVPDGAAAATLYVAAGTASEVGGDFYDLFAARGGWLAMIGDACGKGPEASALTALVRHTLRAESAHEQPLSRALERLNDAIRAERGSETFCTVALVGLRRRGRGFALDVALAGHPHPLVVRRDGAVEPVGRAGTLLGVLESVAVTDVAASLAPGESLVMYTDGVTEAAAPGGARFGEEALGDVLEAGRDLPPHLLARAVVEAVRGFAGRDPDDDMALLIVRAENP